MFEIASLTHGFPDRPDFLGPINLRIEAGQFWGIIGPNGAGKSTLLRILAGLITVAADKLNMQSQPMQAIPPRHRAQQIAYVPQQPTCDPDLLVADVVLMGRYPHRRFGMFESADDYEIAHQAMIETCTEHFANRRFGTLSGGEAQRVHLAAAIAQSTKAILLDEPTAAMDLAHQIAIFRILRQRADTNQQAIVAITHDMNLAARYCTHVLLLHDGKQIAAGVPASVLTIERLEHMYGIAMYCLPAETLAKSTSNWFLPRT